MVHQTYINALFSNYGNEVISEQSVIPNNVREALIKISSFFELGFYHMCSWFEKVMSL